jgi:hypothetical protein
MIFSQLPQKLLYDSCKMCAYFDEKNTAQSLRLKILVGSS